jgi:hypothetical protein
MITIVGVGYGDILSTNYSERGFSIFLLAIGVLVYSWFVSAFAKYREESFVSGGKADECLKKLDYIWVGMERCLTKQCLAMVCSPMK